MADQGPQLDPTVGRPLLAFGPPTVGAIPTNPDYRPAMPPRPRRPGRTRQGQRLTPQFRALQEALAADTTELSESTNSPDPEFVVVFEVAGTIDRFMRAAQGIEGINFITDFVGAGIEPDEEFYNVDDDGDPVETSVHQTLYLVMANAQAIDELVRLFELYQADRNVTFETGLAPLKSLFDELHTVRRWGAADRVAETGLIEDWQERLELIGANGVVRVEIELVWRGTASDRSAAAASVEAALGEGTVKSRSQIPAIQYHAILADVPAADVQSVLDEGPSAIELLQADDVLFVSPARPMSLATGLGEDRGAFSVDTSAPTEPPVAALLDGLPLANHDLLKGRLSIDDPADRSSRYSPSQCGHGTSMASLILHGDLSDPGPVLRSQLYVLPVMVPHEWAPDTELVPPDELFVDVIHVAFAHMFGEPEPAAPSVRVVNISLGDPGRVFDRRLSPLARLLDYFAHRYNLLIVVSAGNQSVVDPTVPAEVLDDPVALDSAVHVSARHRRMVSPAEAINVLTVGATHADSSTVTPPESIVDPLVEGSVATYSPQGAGFRRSPKPEILAPGGRAMMLKPVGDGPDVRLEPAYTEATGPGVQVAAPNQPGATNGTLFTTGTSNAAALVTRNAVALLDTLKTLPNEPGEPEFPAEQYHPVLAKALLVHSAVWPEAAEQWAEDMDADGNTRRRLLTQHVGFGVLAPERIIGASPRRVTLLGAGAIANNKRHSFRFPLPPGMASAVGWRRLVVTLGWLTPTVPNTQRYRTAELSFGSPRNDLRIKPTQADHVMNGKGTVLHEVLEGRKAAGYTDDTDLAIDVDCKVRVGRLERGEGVRYGLAVTLEVGPEIQVDVHSEVRDRLRAQVRQTVRARG